MARIFDKINNVAFSAERIQQEGKEKGGEQPSKVSLRENGISFFLSSLLHSPFIDIWSIQQWCVSDLESVYGKGWSA